MSISVEQALTLILEHTSLLGEEQAPLKDSIGRILCKNVYAKFFQPPFDRSPLDGYALRSKDLESAAPETPAVLKVVDKLYAGDVSSVPVLPGQAVRLMTGSMLPQGADCVIRQEDTDEGEENVRVFKHLASGSNICFRGEEYQSGDLLIGVGQRIDATAIAVAAGAGLQSLPVRRRMRAAVISTGDELQQPGLPLLPGKIYNSNADYLAASLRQMGVDLLSVRTVNDDINCIADTLSTFADKADLILTTGGVSVGQKDLMKPAVLKAGGDIIFHGVSMKPGMPTLFAAKSKTLILCLSGNPFSAAVPFSLFVRPILAHMTQDPAWELQWERAYAATPFLKSSPTRRFLRGIYQAGAVTIPGKQSNGQMRSMIGCNCLIDIPAGTAQISVGDAINILRI